MEKQKWVTVMMHRSYQIQVLSPAKHDFGYRINDPAFLPDYKRYDTIDEAVQEIDEKTK